MQVLLKKNEKVDDEIVHLNDNLLNAPVSPEITNFFDNSLTFSLLNIRSILGKLLDLETDCNINQ